MRPSKIALWIAILWMLIGLLVAFFPALLIVWKVLGIGFVCILLIDAAAVFSRPDIEIKHEVNHNLPIYSWSNVKQVIRNRSSSHLDLLAHDHYPIDFKVESLPESFSLKPNERAELRYRIKPLSRGNYNFKGTDILRRSPLRLWLHKFFYHNEKSVRVFPNFASISKYILLATDNRFKSIGH